MKSALIATTVGVAVVLTGMVGAQSGLTSAATAAPGVTPATVDNFQLADHTRLAHTLYYFKDAPAIVIMTQANGSAVSRSAAAELQKLADTYTAKGVLFYMLNSNLGETREQVSAEVARLGTKIPVLMDEQQLVGESLGVQREAEVFVINPKTWQVAYRGALDDRFAKANPNAAAKVSDAHTAKALDAVLAGQPVQTARVDLRAGKTIAFPELARSAQFANISYEKEIAPIIEEKCVTCHMSGGIGPFALDGYEKVKGFAPMIRETLRSKRMPPYFPDPHIGAFKNDQGLTGTQLKKLVHWVEAGAPRGTGGDPLLKYAGMTAPEWPVSLGKPDVIVEIPAFNVPATGIVAYQNQRVDNPFSQDTFLRAISIKPGNRAVLHHVVSNHVPDPTQPRSSIPGGSVGSYTPGADAQVMGEGAGAPVPAGGRLNFQMHYTTAGRPITDKTQVGFYVLKEPPKYIKRSVVISDGALEIPAGQGRHKEIAYLEFPADAYLYTLYPHAHYRGYHVELKAKTPDGKETMLLSLPKYDFNWQRDYDPIEPILVKAGTKLIATWVYDNSTRNVANPDPKINVTWGEQTHQEMMYFRVNYRWADETVGNLRNDLQAKMMDSRQLGGLDDNADNLVQIHELRGNMTAARSQFASLDKDRNGGLDKAELAAAPPSAFARQRARQAEVDATDL